MQNKITIVIVATITAFVLGAFLFLLGNDIMMKDGLDKTPMGKSVTMVFEDGLEIQIYEDGTIYQKHFGGVENEREVLE